MDFKGVHVKGLSDLRSVNQQVEAVKENHFLFRIHSLSVGSKLRVFSEVLNCLSDLL